MTEEDTAMTTPTGAERFYYAVLHRTGIFRDSNNYFHCPKSDGVKMERQDGDWYVIRICLE